MVNLECNFSDIKPLVSVIIPSFNRREYLFQSIESVLQQSYANLQVIVVDDGSTDRSIEFIASLLSDPRIVVYRQQNLGPSAARNLGLDHACGKFIQFLDSDDILASDKIARQVDYLMKHPSTFGVYCLANFFEGNLNNKIGVSSYPPSRKLLLPALLDRNFIPTNSLLIRASHLRFDETLKRHEDQDFLIRIALENKILDFIPEVLCFIRVHNSNLTNDTKKMLKSFLKLVLKYESFGILPEIILLKKIQLSLRLGQLKRAKSSFKKLIQIDWMYALKAFLFSAKHILKSILGIRSEKIYSHAQFRDDTSSIE